MVATGLNGCETTIPIAPEVENRAQTLDARIDAPINPTACTEAEANGSMTAVVDSPTPLSDVTFEWFLSDTPGSAGSGFDVDQTITGLWIGDYSLRVTHRSTGCSVEDNVRLTQEIVDFSVASTLQEDNTNCQAPFNGSIGGISVIYDGSNVPLNRVGFQINGSDAVLSGGVAFWSIWRAVTYYKPILWIAYRVRCLS